MGKLEAFDIVLNADPEAAYYPGQVVSGHVVLNLKDEMKMRGIRVKCIGRAEVQWSEQHHGSSDYHGRHIIHTPMNTNMHGMQEMQFYSNSQSYFNDTITVYGKADGQSGDDPVLPAGNYNHPFQYTLPQNLPSSFEGSHGWVRFWLEAVIEIPWKSDKHHKKAITVISVVDLNHIPDVRQSQGGREQKTLCCWRCESGPITADFTMDRKGFVPGEFVIISGEVTNNSNRKMTASKVQLRRYTFYHAIGKTLPMIEFASELRKGDIAVGGSEIWSGEKLYIPPLPPSGLPNCKIITILYHIVMIVDPSGCSFDLEVPLEVIIGTIPLTNIQPELANTTSNNDEELNGPSFPTPIEGTNAPPPPIC